MKKYISLLASTAFIASCGCGAEDDGNNYNHTTGMPEGPDGSYGSDILGIPVYEYNKAEADLIAGNIEVTEYCEIENNLFPTNFATELDCANSEFVKLFSRVMKDDSAIRHHLTDIVSRVQDTNSENLAFDELNINVDYSGYLDDVSTTDNTVLSGGQKITMEMVFSESIYASRGNLITQLSNAFGPEYKTSVDLATPEVFVLTRMIEDHSITYNMVESNNKWIIESKN